MAKKNISIRISEPTDLLLKELAKKRDVTQAQIIDEAIRLMAKKVKIKLD